MDVAEKLVKIAENAQADKNTIKQKNSKIQELNLEITDLKTQDTFAKDEATQLVAEQDAYILDDHDITGGSDTYGLVKVARQRNPLVYEAGINNGIEQGEQDGLRTMWEALQAGGTRTDYGELFKNVRFTKKTFKPIYDIKLTGTDGYLWTRTCLYAKLLNAEGTIKMKELEEEQGIKFDFSECANLDAAFSGGLFSELNVIDISKVKSSKNNIFYGGYFSGENKHLRLKRIEKLICSEITTFATTSFSYATNLYYIGFEGVIGVDIDLGYCPLIKDSITKLFNTLSTTATGKTVTLNKSAVNVAFGINVDDETTFPEGSEYYTLRHSKDNWTVNYI